MSAFATSNEGNWRRDLLHDLHKEGWATIDFHMEASDLLPQTRPRWFLIAIPQIDTEEIARIHQCLANCPVKFNAATSPTQTTPTLPPIIYKPSLHTARTLAHVPLDTNLMHTLQITHTHNRTTTTTHNTSPGHDTNGS